MLKQKLKAQKILRKNKTMSLNPEQESPLEQYQPRGEFFSVVGSVYRYLSFSRPPSLSLEQLAGQGQVDVSAFIGHMQDSGRRFHELSRPTRTGDFSLTLEACRELLQRTISRSTYFGAASISSVGPLPVGGRPSGNVVQLYPKKWSPRDQVAAFMLDERRYTYGSLDVAMYRYEGRFALAHRISELGMDSLKNYQLEEKSRTLGARVTAQHHDSLMLGLDSSEGQQRFMKFVTASAVLLEAAKIKYER